MSEDVVDFPIAERMRGNSTRAPHCWFCGSIEPWFQCGCSEARDAQQGSRAKPRYDAKRGCMILDEEIIQRNLAWGFARRYEPPVNKANTEMLTAPVNTPHVVNTPANNGQSSNRDRNAYHREYMRKKREAAKGVASDDEPAA